MVGIVIVTHGPLGEALIRTAEFVLERSIEQVAAVRIDSQQQVEQVLTLDLGASLLALKVDLTQWQSESPGAYLSLVAPRSGKGLAEILRQLAGFADTVDKSAATRDFLEQVKKIFRQQ